MNKEKILIFIGSCGKSWPLNTTPIQRGLALEPLYDKIFFIDTESELSPFFNNSKSKFLKVESYKSIRNKIHSILYSRDLDIDVIHGPNWKIAYELLDIRKEFKFRWIIDLFDHPNLTSNIYLTNKKYAKFIYHRFSERYLLNAINNCDLLISSIHETSYKSHSNRVKCINGVSYQDIQNTINKKHIIDIDNHTLHVGYIGVLSLERAKLIIEILKNLKYKNVRVFFHLVGDYDQEFLDYIKIYQSDLINIKLYGFVSWENAINIINNVDICLYTFPINNRPELDCVYPIKLGEYLALGKPILSVNSSAIKEIIQYIGHDVDIDLIDENNLDIWVNQIVEKANLKVKNGTLHSVSNKEAALNKLCWSKVHEGLLSKLR